MSALTAWIDGYLVAWNTNAADDIRRLFTADAEYRTEPYAAPWVGHEAIVNGWLARPDDPGDTSFEWNRVTVDGDLHVITGTTRYAAEQLTFSNLWLVRLTPEGRCSSFTEYWMEHPRD
ncbi:nuclear transport factor 2 family protein [Spongisporangium articulatum]|uniref:Nuclear transport factor 2 family protein n=1 Tax=Spongisporangium articulatum TaxID=3362603 RepID=A0ABW8AJS0_9ACTN